MIERGDDYCLFEFSQWDLAMALYGSQNFWQPGVRIVYYKSSSGGHHMIASLGIELVVHQVKVSTVFHFSGKKLTR
jgi:hypothetical protein